MDIDRPAERMNKLDKVRRKGVFVHGVPNNVFGVRLMGAHVKHVNGIASSGAHRVQHAQIFAEVRGAAVQSDQCGRRRSFVVGLQV